LEEAPLKELDLDIVLETKQDLIPVITLLKEKKDVGSFKSCDPQ